MSLFIKELWELRYRLIVMVLLIIGLGLFVMGSYEVFVLTTDINEIELAIKSSVLSKYISAELITNQLTALKSNIDLYVWSQWFGKNFLQLILLSVILLGFSSFAREAEHNTNSFLLTNFTRLEVFLTKIYAGILSIFSLVAIGSFLPVVIAVFSPFNFDVLLAWKYFIQILPAALLLYAIIILFSVLAKDVIKPIIFGIIAFVLLSLLGKIEVLREFNIYRFLSGADIFTYGQVNFTAVIIINIFAIALFFITYKLYKNADF